MWDSVANFKLDELVSRRPPSEKTQALSRWLHKGSKVQARVLGRLGAFAII